MKKNKLFCILGGSGSGKDTLANLVGVPKVISYRTRPMREYEVNGQDGYFISKKQFLAIEDQMIAKTCYADHFYGVTEAEIEKLNEHSLIYIIDLPGVNTLIEYAKSSQKISEDQIVTIYIDAPTTSLRNRMVSQGRSLKEIERRMDHYWDVDFYVRDQCKYVIFNADKKLDDSVKRLTEIISKECLGENE